MWIRWDVITAGVKSAGHSCSTKIHKVCQHYFFAPNLGPRMALYSFETWTAPVPPLPCLKYRLGPLPCAPRRITSLSRVGEQLWGRWTQNSCLAQFSQSKNRVRARPARDFMIFIVGHFLRIKGDLQIPIIICPFCWNFESGALLYLINIFRYVLVRRAVCTVSLKLLLEIEPKRCLKSWTDPCPCWK